jgi:hypothetical protein
VDGVSLRRCSGEQSQVVKEAGKIEQRLGRVLLPQKPGPKRRVADATTLPLFD